MQLSDIVRPFPVVNQKYHVNRNTVFAILIGFLFGFGFTYLLFLGAISDIFHAGDKSRISNKFTWRNKNSNESNNKAVSQFSTINDKNFNALLTEDGPDQTNENNIATKGGNDAEAQELFKKVKVVCWIMTMPKYHLKKAINIKKTWGKRCTKLLFMSTKEDSELPSVVLRNVEDSKEWRWGKTKEAIKYIYEHHLADADWFLKADDDTYVIMENLRYLLNDYNPNQPYLFGCEFKPQWSGRTFVSGEAGYVMSKEALRRFVEKSLKMNDSQCLTSTYIGREDIEVSKCLLSVNTTIGDSRDSLGRYRFMAFHPTSLLGQGLVVKTSWYWNWIKYPQKSGMNCCSDTPISFHFVNPDEFFYFEYMTYHIRPYGINRPKIIRQVKTTTTNTKTISTTSNPKLNKNTKALSVKMKSTKALTTTTSPVEVWDSQLGQDLLPDEIHFAISTTPTPTTLY